MLPGHRVLQENVLNPGNELSILKSILPKSMFVFLSLFFFFVVNTNINIFILFYDIKYISNSTLMIFFFELLFVLLKEVATLFQ